LQATKEIKEEWFKLKGDTRWYEYIVNLPEKEKVVYTVAILDEEVNNGGFNQYFINNYGQFAKETIRSLKVIKADRIALLLSNALDKVQSNLSDTRFREKLLLGKINKLYESEVLDDYLSNLDDKYYEYSDDVGKLLVAYLSQ
jgi:hypothetical protein